MSADPPGFFEVVPFRLGPGFWVAVALGALVPLLLAYGVVQQLVLGVPFGSRPLPNGLLALLAGLLALVWIGVLGLMMRLRLQLRVAGGVLGVRMPPLAPAWRNLALADLRGAEALTVRPLREYGGTGLRKGRFGTAYLVNRDRAVRLTLADGTLVVVSSSRSGELADLVNAQLGQGD